MAITISLLSVRALAGALWIITSRRAAREFYWSSAVLLPGVKKKENWNSLEVNARGRYNTNQLWRTKDGQELHPHTNYYVDGNTKFYGAALFRLREQDFGEIKHYGGISPAWPISYNELEPCESAII